MKRLCSLAALMVLTTSACAGESISFSVGGHRIRIEAPRNCRSTSCASVSVSGLFESRRRRDRDDDDRGVAPPSPPPAPAPAPAQVSPPPTPPPVALPQNKPVIAAAPAVTPATSVPAVGFATAAASTRPALPPLPPVPPPPRLKSSQPISQPCVMPPAQKPIEAAPAKPPVIKALHEEESDTPLGDWQTESKGVVRIAQCGSALCGYTLNASSNDKGEAVLINMKPKTDTRWTGSVYSKDSGDTYYGTADLKGPNTLRVEACAFSRFYCSGNNWIRISTRPMITSRQVEARPRS